MTTRRNAAPVIIKRKKIINEAGHHGGAWKVAYADFVTAMMAFFMLMWLLNATTEKQRKGIADYFSPTAPISRLSSGSDGMMMGESVFAADVLPRMGVGASSLHESTGDASGGGLEKADDTDEQTQAFQKVEDVLLGLGGETMLEDNWLRHVVTRITDEGLVLEFFDTPGEPLFSDGAEPTELTHQIAYAVREASRMLINEVAVEGHVAEVPIIRLVDPVWDWSSDRAFVFAQLLEDYGFSEDRIRRVTAYGDREPLVDNTMSERNNRLEVIFLRY
ncbi:flagellar motor protein MotB [Marivita sp. GX14005]|uniref:OmpA/MotB family protein n=1 Tax=Marivita sp. GX14005 TaxID=2942276 RepID=UPI00201950A3|nr:flagellar motor protein MotB [Marivita sp. GX14005]MCL3881756.1 flagellar motor protein MotB [Marivita sp. GX14005]